MWGKFYKLLIIWNLQPAILHIPNGNSEIIAFQAMICQGSGPKFQGCVKVAKIVRFSGRHAYLETCPYESM